MNKTPIAHLRREYNTTPSSGLFQSLLRILSVGRREVYSESLSEAWAPDHPFPLFQSWLEEAVNAGMLDPTAMTLGTLAEGNQPSLRTVLLKGFDGKGFVFYTHYNSRKAREIRKNPAASLLFYWPILARQVRIDGKVSPVPARESDDYFETRPRGSQLAAWACPQSSPVPNRGYLEQQMRVFGEKFGGKEVPRPPHWGGYRLVAQSFEFWSGRPNRLHDRLYYRKKSKGGWVRTRLAP
jgi:pyridoxamine 5'-phosphate oxidase